MKDNPDKSKRTVLPNGDDLLQVATAKLAGGEIELTSEADDRVIAAELDEDRELEVEQ
jgi:hypothetical protein